MDNISPRVNIPIRSVQTALRTMSFYYDDIPPVIPDGKFGTQTRDAVLAFQQKFELLVTGDVDFNTWEAILRTYREVLAETSDPRPASIFPSATYTIVENEQDDILYVIQAMLLPLTKIFVNLGTISMTGVNDEETSACVRKLQRLFNLEETGVIDKIFWENLTGLYEAWVTKKAAASAP